MQLPMLGQLAGRVQSRCPERLPNQFWARLVAQTGFWISSSAGAVGTMARGEAQEGRRCGVEVVEGGQGGYQALTQESGWAEEEKVVTNPHLAHQFPISQEDSGYNSSRLGVGRTLPPYSQPRNLTNRDTDDDEDDISEVLRQPLKDDDNRTLETFHEKRRRMNQKKRVVLKGGKFLL